MEFRQEKYLASIYGRTEGKVGLLCIPKDGSKAWQKMYDTEDIPCESFCNENMFLTLNTFKKRRLISDVKRLNAAYLDIDPYHVGRTVNEVLDCLHRLEYGKSVPYPTIEIRSGHGIYLIWLIDPSAAEKIEVWNCVQRALCSALSEYGSDPRSLDAARVLRVPGSINAKTDDALPVEVETWRDAEYSLDELVQWLGVNKDAEPAHKPQKRKKDSKRKEGGAAKKGLRSPKNKSQGIAQKRPRHYTRPINRRTAAKRAEDIRTVLLSAQMNVTGHREVALFLFRHFLLLAGATPKDALRETLALNRKLVCPLPEREAREATKSAENRLYCPSNDWIIDQLDIPLSVQRSLQTILSAEAKAMRRREKQGRTISRAQETAQKRAKISAIRAEGYNVTETCALLGISRSTYYNIMHGRKASAKRGKTAQLQHRKRPLRKKVRLFAVPRAERECQAFFPVACVACIPVPGKMMLNTNGPPGVIELAAPLPYSA